MAEVCAERGAANVTVAHVVARSGVSRRTFYEQFPDRDACFLVTLDEALEHAAGYLLPAYDASARWHERMRASLVALLSFLGDEPSMGRVLVVESLGGGSAALARRKRILASVLAAVDEGRTVAKGGADLPPLTAEGVVGGVLSVIHTRLLDPAETSLLDLTGPLMSMIVLPYLGAAAARKELERPIPAQEDRRAPSSANPLRDLEMRLTYRTVRVLMSVAANPRCSNREIARAADIDDQGQASKLLTRLSKLGLIENSGEGLARGAPNAWVLTEKGAEVETAVGVHPG
jgi:AcrR family transcriptional regulator/DNA-binding MarR family transcriptional regulator